MATFALSSNSSLDLLATELNDIRSSPVHESKRVFKRTPSPTKSPRATPSRDRVLQLQDYYIATPDAVRSYRISPTRSIAESENIVSPWRIRVRVEAEPDDAPEHNVPHYRMEQSTTTAQARATTMVVPLNDDSDSSRTPKKSVRKRKSMQRRPPTPKPTKSRKRVLEEIENEESVRPGIPKRSKRKGTPETNYSVQPSIEDDQEAPMLQLDDLLEAADVIGEGSISMPLGADEMSGQDAKLLEKPMALDQTTGPGQGKSPFKFRRQGQDVSFASIEAPTSSNMSSRRKLLISDFAEPRAEYDSIMEGEDFTMISLSSVPSAQQHLSLRKDAITKAASVTSPQKTSPDPPPGKRRPVIASPTSTGPTSAFKNQHFGRRFTNATNEDETLILSPAGIPQTRFIPSAQPNFDSISSAETRSATRQPDIQYSRITKHLNTSPWAVPVEKLQHDDDPLGRQDQTLSPLVSTRMDTPDLKNIANTRTQDTFVPVTTFNEFDRDVAWEKEEDQPPDYLPQDEEPTYHQVSEIRDTPVYTINAASRSEPGSDGNNARPMARVTHFSQQRITDNHDSMYPDQSSILQLPEKGRPPTQLFSSPLLPIISSLRKKPSRPIPKPKVATPKLKRVVKAGKALQHIVEPFTEQRSSETSKPISRHSSKEPAEHIFSGFSMASRRELRARLRLGEELAKRQSSMLDITMNSAPPLMTSPSPDQPSSIRETGAEPRVEETKHGITIVKYPDLSTRSKTQLLSPETSSNDTEQRQASMLERPNHTKGIGSIASLDTSRSVRAKHQHPHTNPLRVDFPEHPEQHDHDSVDGAFDDGYQGEGFGSDDDYEPEIGNGNEPENGRTSYEETDVWQLEAKAPSPSPASVSNQQHVAAASCQEVQRRDEYKSSTDPRNTGSEHEDDDFHEEDPELFDFDEERAAMSSRIHSPYKPAGVLTPSNTTSSPIIRTQRDGEDEASFTGFTRDLLQAASRQPHQYIMSRVDEEHTRKQTPNAKVSLQHENAYADVFTTRSILETSAASIGTQKSPARRHLSFRPTNRKESWLFDPKRLRKPPSPLKQTVTSTLTALSPNSVSPPPVVSSLQSNVSEQAKNRKSLRVLPFKPQRPTMPKTLQSDATETPKHVPSTSDARFADSSPLSIFVAAAQKAKERNKLQEKLDNQSAPSNIMFERPRNAVNTSKQGLSEGTTKPIARQPWPKSQAKRNLPSSRTNSSSQASELNTAQSSFHSNHSTNTSVDEDDNMQTTWYSFLTNVASPLIASTKAISTFASTTFQQAQQQTFYPAGERNRTGPARLTIHQPFNDAHWLALRTLYITALKQPKKFKLTLNSRCAEYIGLEIESLGWRRALREWELAVVAQFLDLLQDEGIYEDSDEPPIDNEAVIKRVFSLWVGMVTRGELELTVGKAGAWDRRFVGRRNKVLQKQKEWQRTHT